MKALENKILKSGKVIDNKILKVDNFFNYQIDTKTLKAVAKFIAQQFKKAKVDKILTIETSGIAFAIAVAFELGNIPVVFAKKSKTALTSDDENYVAEVPSYTHNTVNQVYIRQRFISPKERILIIDDFMAVGSASVGLCKICKDAHARVVGVGVGIEKEFQGGRKKLKALRVPVVSAARIVAFKNNKPVFSKEKF